MCCAVVTVTIGSEYEKLAQISHPSINVYARKLGADFIVIKDRTCPVPAYEKLQIKELLVEYERVLYLDTDVLVSPDAEDIFEMVPVGHIGAYNDANESPTWHRQWEMFNNKIDSTLSAPSMYMNTSVMLFDRAHAPFMYRPTKYLKDSMYEQAYINSLITRYGLPIHCLPKRMNFVRPARPLGAYLHKAGIMHYPYSLVDRRHKMMKYDATEWRSVVPA